MGVGMRVSVADRRLTLWTYPAGFSKEATRSQPAICGSLIVVVATLEHGFLRSPWWSGGV